MFNPFHFFFGPDGSGPEEFVPQDGRDSAPSEPRRREGSGSGFIIRKDGHILTNNHVIEGASKLIVTLGSGERYKATVKGKDESTDLALLKIDCPQDLPALPLGDSEKLRIGEWVLAIGNPLGDQLGDSHTVTIGVLSAKGRQLPDLNMDFTLANYLQTDAAINFGNSGGPLLNSRGEVIGINTAISRNYGHATGLIQGIGFALPIDLAKSVLDQLMTTGKVQRGALAIGIVPIDDKKAKYYGLPNRKGAFVQNVAKDGPAARAGMEVGDIILSVDGREIGETGELIQIISAHRPGETVEVGVLRDGRPVKLRVKLTDRMETLRASAREPDGSEEEGDDQPDPATEASLGFTVATIAPSHAREHRLPRTHVEGVVITHVAQDGEAWEDGVREGMIVTQVGEESVTSIEEFRAAAGKIRKGEIVRLAVVFYPAPTGAKESRYIFFEAE
jgi:serine protease Do